MNCALIITCTLINQYHISTYWTIISIPYYVRLSMRHLRMKRLQVENLASC